MTGDNNTITGNGNTIRGDNNSIRGSDNTIYGDNCNVVGDYNTCTGDNNILKGVYNRSVGDNNTTKKKGCKIVQISLGDAVTRMKREREEVLYIEVPTEAEALEHDKPGNALECRVCMDNEPLCVILPCMHLCVCCACARKLAADGTKEQGSVECPICKTKIEKMKCVFI